MAGHGEPSRRQPAGPGQQENLVFGGSPAGDPAIAPAGDDFVKRREALWNQIVEKMIPLEVLKEVDVRELTDINAENLNELEAPVQRSSPRKRARNK